MAASQEITYCLECGGSDAALDHGGQNLIQSGVTATALQMAGFFYIDDPLNPMHPC
jgi:hypothetical protein